MKRHAFWAAVALALAAAAHAAFTLYLPSWLFSRELAAFAQNHGRNSFFVLSPGEQARLFPGMPRSGVTGMCLFDLMAGDVAVSAAMPDGPWIATIYTSEAEVIYSVNDRQSGADSFTLRLSRAPSLAEQILSATGPDKTQDIASGWAVLSPVAQGLAIIWYPDPSAGVRAPAADLISASRCSAMSGQ